MVHYFEGQFGHLFVVIAFVSSLLSSWSYFKGRDQDSSWISFGSKIFYIHTASVLGIIGVLFYLISHHYFEYHYVFSHSSRLLPIYYQISCFWEGQEGSFLLWMFWNAVLGIILIRTNHLWKAPVMLFVSLTQAFLASMILGVVVFNVKIGSSPFMLLRDVIDAPIFKMNSEFVPEDGNGLNPLLQNYWMVIHPPVLFLGFATTLIPFAYGMGGLVVGRNKEWIAPALPWAQFSALALGVGILMGAYWAYETLNFGGYWNWDPVENAIYVPWLTMVAAIHVMIIYKKSGKALKLTLILVMSTFILILYATFLTRSGILGNSSVHSFTDLGLSGQLLLYLLFFLALALFLMAKRWKSIPTASQEMSVYSREFWIFIGATVLGLMAFQVLVYTSMPVYNRLAESAGIPLNLAPPIDTHDAYSFPQLILSVCLAVLSGTAQFFWWKNMDITKIKMALTLPFLISLVVSAVIIVFSNMTDPAYLVLLIASVYSIVANAKILMSIVKWNGKLSGGAVAHIGVALMLIGILFSSGHSKILSTNYTSMIWSKDFPDEVNQNNLLLFINEPRQMGQYAMVYKGMRQYTKEMGMVDKYALSPTNDPLKYVRKNDYGVDTLTLVNPENNYFEIAYSTASGRAFTLFPKVQMNETMDITVYSPDIYRTVSADVYTHVRTFPKPTAEEDWSKTEQIKVPIGGQFYVNDYVATLEKLEPVEEIKGTPLAKKDIAVKAVVHVQGEYKNYLSEPIFIIKNREFVGRVDDHVRDLAFRISIQNILPREDAVIFGIQTTQKDWIILEAVKKPWINLLWLGACLLVIGFGMAIYRRWSESKKMRDKGTEL